MYQNCYPIKGYFTLATLLQKFLQNCTVTYVCLNTWVTRVHLLQEFHIRIWHCNCHAECRYAYCHDVLLVTYTLAYYSMVWVNVLKSFKALARRSTPGANVLKTFTTVIYCHTMVILSFCLLKLYCLGKYCGMAAYYEGIVL